MAARRCSVSIFLSTFIILLTVLCRTNSDSRQLLGNKRFPDALSNALSRAKSKHSKALSDLSAKDSHALERLMSRPELRKKLAPHLNMLNQLTGSAFSPPAIPGTMEVSFSLNAPTPIFVRQAFPATMDEERDFVLLFLHGAAYTSATWSELGILSDLAAQGVVSYALDIPGYGQSAGTKIKDNAWLRKVISMLTDPKAQDAKVKKALSESGAVDTTGKTIVVVTASMSGQYAIPLLKKPPSNLAGMVTVAPVKTDALSPKEYAKVKLPVCIIYGALDDQLGEESKKNLVQIPNHKLVVVPNGEHAAYKSDPQFFEKQVLKWLNEFFD